MRATFLGLALLGTALFAAPALAGDFCLPDCEVRSHSLFYAPTHVVVTSGSTLVWTTLDVAHTATDREGFCFHTDYHRNSPGSAQFVVADGALYAKGSDDAAFSRCDRALGAPEGGFLLEYTCLYHPNMRANVLVR